MKKLLFLLLLLPSLSFGQVFGQSCVSVDTVYSTAKMRDLGNRDIRFGVKQIAEEQLSSKYCLSGNGDPIKIEIFYFGIPKTTLRIAGIEKTEQTTQVGVRMFFKGEKYEGYGESETELRAMMIEITEGGIPFEKMTLSNSLKKAIEQCVLLLP